MNAYQLAGLADCASPDSQDSPGAEFLRLVAGCYVPEELDEHYPEDTISEWADSCVPIYTHTIWTTFVDLAAYQEDVDEFGPYEDLTKAAQVALYLIAERLLTAIHEENTDND